MFCVRGQYGWSTPCKNKLLNGEEITAWLELGFLRGQEPSKNKIYINVTKFFMTSYLMRNGEVKPKMFIQEWQEDLNTPQQTGYQHTQNNNQSMADPFANKTIRQNQAPSNVDNSKPDNGYVDIKTSDLPFY